MKSIMQYLYHLDSTLNFVLHIIWYKKDVRSKYKKPTAHSAVGFDYIWINLLQFMPKLF